MQFLGINDSPVVTMKQSKRKMKMDLHPVTFDALRKKCRSTTQTVCGLCAFQKTWMTNDNTKKKVVFRCNPNCDLLGKNWCNWAMVLFKGTDPTKVPTTER